MTATTVQSALVIVALFLGQSNQSVPPSRGEFTLQISMKDSGLTIGTEARVSVVLTNTSDRTFAIVKKPKFGEGRAGEDVVSVYVLDGAGRLAPETKYGHKLRSGEDPPGEPKTGRSDSAVLKPVPPGEADTSAVTLNTLYELTQPGTYTVQVQRLGSNNVLVKSNTLTFTLTAPPR
jgi:hypothetical protein